MVGIVAVEDPGQILDGNPTAIVRKGKHPLVNRPLKRKPETSARMSVLHRIIGDILERLLQIQRVP